MVLSIILLILIILIVSMLILFSVYVLLPSINMEEKNKDDPLIPTNKKDFLIPDYKVFEKTKFKAVVLCNCNKTSKLERTEFNEQYSCFMVKNTYGTGLDCKFACIGLGDCTKVCPQQAISIQNNTAVITNNCCGCGKCIEVCPQNVIKLIPTDSKSIVLCNNNSEDSLTTCNKKQVEENIFWNDKKDFKIWKHCYKIFRKLFKR